MTHGGTQAKKGATTAQGIGCLLVVAILLIIGGAWAWGKVSGGPPASYKAAVTSQVALNPATLAVTIRVTDTGQGAGTPACTIDAQDPSDAYHGEDIATLKDKIRPGQTANFEDNLVITSQGARYVTRVTVSCS